MAAHRTAEVADIHWHLFSLPNIVNWKDTNSETPVFQTREMVTTFTPCEFTLYLLPAHSLQLFSHLSFKVKLMAVYFITYVSHFTIEDWKSLLCNSEISFSYPKCSKNENISIINMKLYSYYLWYSMWIFKCQTTKVWMHLITEYCPRFLSRWYVACVICTRLPL